MRRVTFDRFLLSCAEKEGVEVQRTRVTGINFPKGRRDRVFIYSESGMVKADAERPNWMRKAMYSFEAFSEMPRLTDTLKMMNRFRKRGKAGGRKS